MFQVTQDTCSFSVTMTTELTNVDKCIEQLKQFLKTTNQQHTFFHVALLAREALNNAMVHGNRFQSEKKVFFMYVAKKTQLFYKLKTRGRDLTGKNIWISKVGSKQKVVVARKSFVFWPEK